MRTVLSKRAGGAAPGAPLLVVITSISCQLYPGAAGSHLTSASSGCRAIRWPGGRAAYTAPSFAASRRLQFVPADVALVAATGVPLVAARNRDLATAEATDVGRTNYECRCVKAFREAPQTPTCSAPAERPELRQHPSSCTAWGGLFHATAFALP